MEIVAAIIFIICILTVYTANGLYRSFRSEVKAAIAAYHVEDPGLLTQDDLRHLPGPVQKYLNYAGVVGKPKVWNFRVELEGRMKAKKDSDQWMKMNAVQYNFVKNPVRLFYIKGILSGVPCYGLHAYKNETGTMLVKALGLIPVVNGKGKEMNEGDCVTLFNDMCFMAPATLIDSRITWEPVDDLTVKATFQNGSIKISAVLYFNEKGELVNFSSGDRYLSETGSTYEKLTWTTPVKDYREVNGINLSTYGEAIWTMSDGSQFKYGEMYFKSIKYNCKE